MSTGVTLQHVSNETQVNYSYLNEWINGKRILVYGEMPRIERYFEKLKLIMSWITQNASWVDSI